MLTGIGEPSGWTAGTHEASQAPHAVLLVRCPDRPGIVAAISSFLFRHGANIVALDQHASDDGTGAYFLRLEFDTVSLDVPLDAFERAFAQTVARQHAMDFRISLRSERKRVAVLVSRQDHALVELLGAWRRGELRADVSTVISNHPDLRDAVERFDVPFVHVPNGKEIRAEAEGRMVELLAGTDLVVLARYMQVLSGDFVARFPHRILNIHHSFLPAFIGADPYRQAYQRGVKLVGATAHYVTADLDAGPIIEQDVARVSHRESVDDLKMLGRDLERAVLARAVRWHCDDRVIVHGHGTVVFS